MCKQLGIKRIIYQWSGQGGKSDLAKDMKVIITQITKNKEFRTTGKQTRKKKQQQLMSWDSDILVCRTSVSQ